MIRNYFNNKYFGCVVKGKNTTKDDSERQWCSIGNGWYRIITNKGKADETHIWVTDANAKGELRWLNLSTFTGEIVSFQGERVIYFSGKEISKEKFTFPVLPDYKAIIAKYEEGKGLKKPMPTYEEVQAKDKEELLRLIPGLAQHIDKDITGVVITEVHKDTTGEPAMKFPSVTKHVTV